MLLEATEFGEDIRLAEVWEMIEAIVPRGELRVAAGESLMPAPQRRGEWACVEVHQAASIDHAGQADRDRSHWHTGLRIVQQRVW
ncbi:MAG: hypothetical protein DLM58_05765 [Pseudonocardiales bacterium]|nr:MAG: hypothetical protein DLM58_05765 [Pseudonocardiales bacterium]